MIGRKKDTVIAVQNFHSEGRRESRDSQRQEGARGVVEEESKIGETPQSRAGFP